MTADDLAAIIRSSPLLRAFALTSSEASAVRSLRSILNPDLLTQRGALVQAVRQLRKIQP